MRILLYLLMLSILVVEVGIISYQQGKVNAFLEFQKELENKK